jgi:hypothetical protein
MASNRPKLSPISEEMKAWSAALEAEIGDWPQVATRSFFGFTALYRKDKIFAALPRTRAMGTPNSLAFKLEDAAPAIRARLEADARVGSTQMQSTRWFTFAIASNSDLHGAIDWLGQAYDAAGKGKTSKGSKSKKSR